MAEQLTLPPRLDLSTAPALHSQLAPLLEGDLILDASEVTHLGALGAQLLMAAGRAVEAAGHEFALRDVSDRVRDQLAVMGLTPETLVAAKQAEVST